MSLLFVLLTAAAPMTHSEKLNAVTIYAESIQHPLMLKACKKVLPASKSEFGPALENWLKVNKDLAAEGEKIIRLEGVMTSKDTIAMVYDTEVWVVDSFKQEPKDEKVLKCTELLVKLKSAK